MTESEALAALERNKKYLLRNNSTGVMEEANIVKSVSVSSIDETPLAIKSLNVNYTIRNEIDNTIPKPTILSNQTINSTFSKEFNYNEIIPNYADYSYSSIPTALGTVLNPTPITFDYSLKELDYREITNFVNTETKNYTQAQLITKSPTLTPNTKSSIALPAKDTSSNSSIDVVATYADYSYSSIPTALGTILNPTPITFDYSLKELDYNEITTKIKSVLISTGASITSNSPSYLTSMSFPTIATAISLTNSGTGKGTTNRTSETTTSISKTIATNYINYSNGIASNLRVINLDTWAVMPETTPAEIAAKQTSFLALQTSTTLASPTSIIDVNSKRVLASNSSVDTVDSITNADKNYAKIKHLLNPSLDGNTNTTTHITDAIPVIAANTFSIVDYSLKSDLSILKKTNSTIGSLSGTAITTTLYRNLTPRYTIANLNITSPNLNNLSNTVDTNTNNNLSLFSKKGNTTDSQINDGTLNKVGYTTYSYSSVADTNSTQDNSTKVPNIDLTVFKVRNPSAATDTTILTNLKIKSFTASVNALKAVGSNLLGSTVTNAIGNGVSNLLGQGSINSGNTTYSNSTQNTTTGDLAQRDLNSDNGLQTEIFTYGIIPYALSGLGSKIESTVKSATDSYNAITSGTVGGAITGAMGAVSTAGNILDTVNAVGRAARYLTMAEMGTLLAVNFDTISATSGLGIVGNATNSNGISDGIGAITIKDMSNGGLTGTTYDGTTNIHFNASSNVDKFITNMDNYITKWVNNDKPNPNSQSSEIYTLKENSPLKYDQLINDKDYQPQTVDKLSTEQKARIDVDNYNNKYYKALLDWDSNGSLVLTKIEQSTIPPNKIKSNNATGYGSIQDANGSVDDSELIRLLSNSYFSYIEKSISDGSYSAVQITTGSPSDLKINTALNGDADANENVNLLKNLQSYQISSNSDNILNDDKSSVNPAVRDGSNNFGDIGYITVYTTSSASNNFNIPIQFNPVIQEGGISAKYQATSFLARIGDLQSYVNTSSLSSVMFNAKYLITTTGDGTGSYWYDKYNYDLVSSIENAYRSLVLPNFTSSNNSFEYSRPPLIRIQIGNTTSNNLLTYPVQPGSTNSYFRNFIVQSVNIVKDAETPLLISNSGKIMDYFGYEVSLNLIEVTQNYMDVLPSFNDYYTNLTKNLISTNTNYPANLQSISNEIMALAPNTKLNINYNNSPITNNSVTPDTVAIANKTQDNRKGFNSYPSSGALFVTPLESSAFQGKIARS